MAKRPPAKVGDLRGREKEQQNRGEIEPEKQEPKFREQCPPISLPHMCWLRQWGWAQLAGR